MADELITLAVGFLLTTLCGSLLGFVFQRRHARYQWQRSRCEKELSEAQAVFEEVSRLLDRRLYRTRQLLWSFGRQSDTREERIVAYREIVTEWNDNINRILALLAINFLEKRRHSLDHVIGAEFVAIGRALEEAVRGNCEVDAESVELRVNQLATQVYNFNVHLLDEIRTRRNTINESA